MNKSILLLAVLTMPLLVQIANAQQSSPKATILDTKTLTIKNPKWIDEDRMVMNSFPRWENYTKIFLFLHWL